MFGSARLLILLVTTVSCGSCVLAGGATRLCTVKDVMSLPDDTPVTIPVAIVRRSLEQCLLVSDPLNGKDWLPVYVSARVAAGSTIALTGTVATISGERAISAVESVRMFTNDKGEPAPPLLPGMEATWPYTVDLALGPDAPQAGGDPAEAPTTEQGVALTLPDEQNSIWDAKQTPGLVQLSRKVVTAVFVSQLAPYVDVIYFYIADADTDPNDPAGPPLLGAGIKVVPDCPVPVQPGNIVTVKGELVDGAATGEAWIRATSVGCTGSSLLPRPVGIRGSSAAAGSCGCQPALWPTGAGPGCGVSKVGSRVRVWGRVTSTEYVDSGTMYYVDDGSGASCYTGGGMRTGIGVYYQGANTGGFAVGHFVDGVTGVLGARLSYDGHPVPVVRVPAPPPNVKHVLRNYEGTGTPWTQTFTTIQAAIDAAYAAYPKCEVWVAGDADHPYYERITLRDGVSIYGGFAGDETLREQRDWGLNQTIIDGQQGGSTVTVAWGVERIDGFTIRNGRADYGGGIEAAQSGYLTVANCTVTGNVAQAGAGIRFCGRYVWNCTITGNTAMSPGAQGGGIYVPGGTSPVLLNNIITANILPSTEQNVSMGGGIYCADTGVRILNNVVGTIGAGNAAGRGAGIFTGPMTYGSWGEIARNSIQGNSTNHQYGAGGGYYCDTANVRVYGNLFVGNDGGGRGGAIATGYYASLDVKNNVFWRNHAHGLPTYGGGAIDLDNGGGGGASIISNTFAENWVGTGDWPLITPTYYGGAIRAAGNAAQYYLTNNVFHDNRALTGFSVAALDTARVWVDTCAAYPLGQNDNYYTETGATMTFVGGCLYVDPMFCDVANGGCWLRPESPLRGVGVTPWYDQHPVPREDIEGRPRPGPNGTTDLGAYEDNPDCLQ